jgi:hypothetical protein
MRGLFGWPHLPLKRDPTDAIVEDVIVPKAARFTMSTPKYLSDIDDALQYRVRFLVNCEEDHIADVGVARRFNISADIHARVKFG